MYFGECSSTHLRKPSGLHKQRLQLVAKPWPLQGTQHDDTQCSASLGVSSCRLEGRYLARDSTTNCIEARVKCQPE